MKHMLDRKPPKFSIWHWKDLSKAKQVRGVYVHTHSTHTQTVSIFLEGTNKPGFEVNCASEKTQLCVTPQAWKMICKS